MTDTPTGPLLASEVLADQHYANFVGNSDTGFDAEGQVDALLACSSSGGPVVIGTDGTVRDYPELTEAERVRIEMARGPLTGDDSIMSLAAGLDSLLAILDERFPPPACPCCDGPLVFDESNKPIGWTCGRCSSGFSADLLRDAAVIQDFRCFMHARLAPPAQDAENQEDGDG